MIGRFCLASLAGLAAISIATGEAKAAIIGTYEFNDTGLDLPSNKSIDSQPTGATFSDVTLVGLTENTAGKDGVLPNSGWLGTQEWETGNPGSYNDDKYIGFTITADSGLQIALNSISFDHGMANSETPETVRLLVRSGSSGDFTQVFEETVDFPTDEVGNVRFELGPVDLTSLLPESAESFEFRFQVKDQTGGTAPLFRLGRLDNVALDASIVPEPMSLILAGFAAGAVALIAVRRRR